MNIFGLIGMVEGLAGPGAWGRAFEPSDDLMDALVEHDDLRTGRSGRCVPRGASAQVIAVHSATPPRSRFCLRRVCRSADAGRVMISRVPPLLPGLEYERIKRAWHGQSAATDITYKVVTAGGAP